MGPAHAEGNLMVATVADGARTPAALSRTLSVLFLLVTLGAIGWHAAATLRQGRLIPGFAAFLATFSADLALPYAAALALLAHGHARDGLSLAASTAAPSRRAGRAPTPTRRTAAARGSRARG